MAPGAARAPFPGSAQSTLGRAADHRAASAHAAQRFAGGPLDYDVRDHATQVAARTTPALAAPGGSGLRPATTDVMVGGLAPGAFKLAAELLSKVGMTALQAGGTGRRVAPEADAPHTFVDGGVIMVQLVRGDVGIHGLGTVTHVVGDKLVAFGHPMLNGGVENLPTALGTVHWIMSTQNRSFKVGEPTQTLGALVNDRQASIVVHTQRTAPSFPVNVTIEGVAGAPHPNWNMRVAHDQFLAPMFSAVAIGSALETTSAERNDLTWRATSKIGIAGYGSITIEDFGAGSRTPIGPGDFARSRMSRALGALLNNPWHSGTITGVDTKVRISHRRETMVLRGSELLESTIDVGQPARVRLTFDPHLGKRRTRIVEIPIDAGLAGQKVRIKLRPAHQQQRVVAPPESYADLVRVLPKLDFPAEALIATYQLPKEAGAAFEGKVAHRLPPGAADTLRPTTKSLAPMMFGAFKQVVIPLKGFVIGQDSVEVRVREVVR
ncbi:MAG: hypothetical protein DRI90_26905 [Deltaproteobacteria bacterium]|nr:MAG: hypothetical protein DRI90_26905 [Deltaproteobacteria bacterium]